MKRIISGLMAVAMLLSLCGCGGASTDATGGTEATSLLEEFLNIPSDDDPVDIYLSIMDFEEAGAQAYVDNLQKENPDKQYRYYDEEYYILTITEGERKKTLKETQDLEKVFGDALNEEYPGVFIKAELSNNLKELTLHFNKEAYEANPMVSFAVLLMGAVYVDTLQAYSLVPLEEREGRILILDEAGNILMDTDEM